ncbi:unnamed protein product [Allacma fusca]|uniref:Uncharacterized protein n=1 Tax=Allacma fusca TaxID=39272 RepID=A0A8J2KNV6_9HEXA|nr:unnamed protein product [Allacma fusca]
MTSVSNPLTVETLALGIVEDAFQAARLHIQHQQNYSRENSDEEISNNMDTVVATPIRKSSLSSFQNRQLRDGRKRSVTFNPTLIQEFIIDEAKASEKSTFHPGNNPKADDSQDSDGEEITKL